MNLAGLVGYFIYPPLRGSYLTGGLPIGGGGVSTLGVAGGKDLAPVGPTLRPVCLATDALWGANECLKVVSDSDKQPIWLDRLSLLDL